MPCALAACALLQACSSGPRPVVVSPPPARTGAEQAQARPAPVPPAVREARVLQAPGLEGVIGSGAAALLRQFGSPRIDLPEGDARKLQFAGPACVLDVYLYPPGQGEEPRATYVEARRASDGREVDRAACIEALRRR